VSEWRDVPLRDLCDSVQYGLTASASDEGADGPQLLRITDIVPPRIDWKAVPVCDASGTATNKYQLRSGDIVVARTGATVGHAKYLDHPPSRAVFASYLVRFQVGRGADPAYVGHIVQSAAYKQFVLAHAGGAAQPNANAKTLGAFPVPLPSLSTQRRIAALLSAFDELIEINERRIEVLEELARSLYREWFVRFRFPGHAAVDFTDSDVGPLPEGWRVAAFAAIGEFLNGYAFKPSHWGDEGIPIIKIKELKQGVTTATPRYGGVDLESRYFVEPGDLLFSWSADLGVYLWAGERGALNQHLFKVSPTAGIGRAYLYYSLEAALPRFRSRAQGTTMKHIKRSALMEVDCVLPDQVLQAAFSETVGPMHEEVLTLKNEVAMLAATRDLLLPRLVTGRLDISEIALGALLPAEAA
jgi:type I restriction enzyme S subunit